MQTRTPMRTLLAYPPNASHFLEGCLIALAIAAERLPLHAQRAIGLTASDSTYAEVVVRSSFPIGRDTELDVAAVRGSIRISEDGSTRALTLEATIRGVRSDPNTVTLGIDTVGSAIRIRTLYPRTTRNFARPLECLPPEDERGDFYHSDVATDISLTIPTGTRLNAHILSGDIEANAPGSRLHLESNTGRVLSRSINR